MSTAARDALSTARSRVGALESAAAQEVRNERREKVRELRTQGRELDAQIKGQATELRRLRAEAEPLWARLPLLQREHALLEEAGPGEFPSDEEITTHGEKLKRVEDELEKNNARRVRLSGEIASAEQVLVGLEWRRKNLLAQIEGLLAV